MNPPREFAVGRVRVADFAEAAPELAQRALAWLERGPAQDEVVLKPGRVWRSGPLGIKLFPAPARPARKLRRSRARRCADLHFALAPVATPRPLLVLESENGDSLLVYEYAHGEFLDVLWESDTRAVEAFPLFLAAMHRRRVFHGDLHVRNCVWNGRDWVLLDLDGVRPSLHALRGKALAFDQWGRVHFDLRGARGVRVQFERYLAAAERRWSPTWSWARVVVTSARIARRRGLDDGYALRSEPDGAPITPLQRRWTSFVSWIMC